MGLGGVIGLGTGVASLFSNVGNSLECQTHGSMSTSCSGPDPGTRSALTGSGIVAGSVFLLGTILLVGGIALPN